jgi:general secretion pathway protein N
MIARFTQRALLSGVVMSSIATATVLLPIESAGDPASQSQSQTLYSNPLWTVPLSDLSATRERPIFSSSRRPRPPAVTASDTLASQDTKLAELERPQLSLLGTIAGDNEGFGIFVDHLTNAVLRLKVGEERDGWVLRAVRTREIFMEKGSNRATLSLPVRPNATPAPLQKEKNVKQLKP